MLLLVVCVSDVSLSVWLRELFGGAATSDVC